MDGIQNVTFEEDDGIRAEEVNHMDNLGTIAPVLTEMEVVGTSYEKFPAIVVRQGFKSYGRNPVLKKFNMTVPEGTIYSLLGSSGCGKTTILSAIVGLKMLDSGILRVFGEIPGTSACGIPGNCVGHMPQDHALHLQLTIQESFDYYGLIYGMSVTKIRERSKFLLKFLNLPLPSQKIDTLSGGQKRRVSLAIAMIHEPKLLILDEPTVGVDHLLRENIWNLLSSLVSNGKTTVVITTHYIEEARGSSTVRTSRNIGLMRNGRLLTESSPSKLLQEHAVSLLEDVVLILSREDTEMDQNKSDGVTASGSNPPQKLFSETRTEETVSSSLDIVMNYGTNSTKNTGTKYKQPILNGVGLSRIKGLIRKDLTIAFRRYIHLFLHNLLPVFQIMVVCLAIGNDPKNLKFGVVNHENPDHCKQTLPNLDSNNTDCGSSNKWGCTFLETLPVNDILNLIPFDTEAEALTAVNKGNAWGYLSIPRNFSSDLRERMLGGISLSNESYDGSTITVQLDMSSQTIGVVLQRVLFETYQIFSANILKECDFDPRASEIPLKFLKPVYGSQEITHREFLAPSTLLGLLFFFPLCSSSIAYISDKKAGTLDRSVVAGVKTVEIMVAHLIFQILQLFVEAGCAFFAVTQVFGIEVQGSVVTAVCLTIVVGIGGMSMGFLVSTFCDDEIQAVLIAIASFFPNCILAGFIWPIEGMPLFLQYVSYLLPCTLACESMRSIVTRGWGVQKYRVWSGFASTFAWIAIYWILTIFIHQRLNKRR